MSRLPREVEHLDNTERFVNWLESQRKKLGISQEDLAQRGGISHTYYSRIVNLGARRRRFGDVGKHISAPQDPRKFKGILEALSEAAGEDLVRVGYQQWGFVPPSGNEYDTPEGAPDFILLAEILQKIGELPPSVRKALLAIIK